MGPTPVIVAVIAAVVGLIVGFQLARWTAADPVSGAGGGPSPHTHVQQAAPGAEVGGLSLSAGGYTLVPEQTVFASDVASSLRFRILGTGGAAVTSYATVQEKPLHLIVVRRDLTGYQHLHPIMAPDGVWSTPLTLATPGLWRAFADFTVVGANGAQVALTLGVDLTVAGAYAPTPLPAVARESIVDGYTVAYQGTPTASLTVPMIFRVYQDGSPIPGLEPYLGSLGHLVVLREGDLGYVHVHADPPTSASDVRFWLTAPSPGRYRMYLDFKFGGLVRTAEFTVQVS